MDFFKKFKVEKPTFQLLPEGEHLVRLTSVSAITSFDQYNGEKKDKMPEWGNATPQLAITVVSAEDGKSGGITHRLNGCGYVKFDDLSEKEIKSGKYESIEGFACKEVAGVIVRIESEKNTQACANIINGFAASLKIPEGENLMDGIKKAIAEKTAFMVTVSIEDYDGKDQYRISKFKAAEAVAEVKEFEE
jgi:hypothetical protein